mgnify:CR=1 FL=1
MEIGSRIYVGNLPYEATEKDLAAVFTAIGPVNEVALIYDRETGRARGFGFVTMETEKAAEAAIEQLDGSQFGGRTLRVKPATPRGRNDRH